jgi:hypothetical protein
MTFIATELFRDLAATDYRSDPGDLTPGLVRWLVDAGIGPLAAKALGQARASLSPDLQELLLAVDLSSRFDSSARADALKTILDHAGDDHGIGLLKGILFAFDFYPEPHWRPMGDIDLLAAPDKTAGLTELLHDLGYVNAAREDAEYFETHHHLMPFHLPGTNIWIEVHTGLFPERSGLAGPGPFDPARVHEHTRQIDFFGHPVSALTCEMQFFHTSAHWAEEIRLVGGLLGLLDIYMLLRKVQSDLDWDWIFSQSGNPLHIAPGQLATGYLERAGLLQLPGDVRASLRRFGKLGRAALKVHYSIIDRYLVLGQQPGNFMNRANLLTTWKTTLHRGRNPLFPALVLWNIAFPEDEAERFSIDYQVRRLRNLQARLQSDR